MSHTTPLEMKEVIEKLRNLKQYLPDEEDVVYEFAILLAQRLEKYHPKVNPAGFNIAVETLFYDLKRGKDSYLNNEPLKSNLVGHSPHFYPILKWSVKNIVRAICPEDFAKGYEFVVEEVREELKKQSSE